MRSTSTAGSTSLTEVGGDPSEFSIDVDEFHRRQQRPAVARMPATMTTLSTHDTKRGEDVRARLDVLVGDPATEWAETLPRLAGPASPRRRLVRAAALAGRGRRVADRPRAAGRLRREGGARGGALDHVDRPGRRRSSTRRPPCSWIGASTTAAPSRSSSDSSATVERAGLDQLAGRQVAAAHRRPACPTSTRAANCWETRSSTRTTADRSISPIGARLLDASLAEGQPPPIDATGAAKLLVTTTALRLRRDRPELFTGYRPVPARGPAAGHVIAFDRGGAITIATRLPMRLAAAGGWADTTVELAGPAAGAT